MATRGAAIRVAARFATHGQRTAVNALFDVEGLLYDALNTLGTVQKGLTNMAHHPASQGLPAVLGPKIHELSREVVTVINGVKYLVGELDQMVEKRA